ncbi:MAG: hypothetical protein SFX73_14450 [Kofleriaceae bacterium]|nr:hypothetical protein [Kofleriaceae bacterium]
MRTLVILCLASGLAHADDALGIGVAVAAGGQGMASYGALELRLDAEWHGARLGLAGRGVWQDGVFRRRDWARPADAVTVIRYLEVHTEHVGFAAGALAPSQLAHVTDGYRASLDDRWRTGARGAVTTESLTLGAEIDDVLAPALVGGALAWELAPPWGVRAAAAVDPTAPGGTASAFELGAARRWEANHRRLELGASVVAEPTAGMSVVASTAVEVEREGTRWSARADLRAGNGTNGAAFGPLYRLERGELFERARSGVGGGMALGVAGELGWITAAVRVRPGNGALATIGAGAPMGRWVQGGGWLAATPGAVAGAAELRVAWARGMFSAFQLARMYATDEMLPAPQWSATAWFGVATE